MAANRTIHVVAGEGGGITNRPMCCWFFCKDIATELRLKLSEDAIPGRAYELFALDVPYESEHHEIDRLVCAAFAWRRENAKTRKGEAA